MDRIALIERYEGLKQRLQAAVERMHYNLAHATDLVGLERLAHAIERVTLHGDRITLLPAQAAAAAAKAEAFKAEAAEAPAALPKPAADVTGTTDATEAVEPPAEGARQAPDADEQPDTLVIGQTPPVAKPGRTRGYVFKGDA